MGDLSVVEGSEKISCVYLMGYVVSPKENKVTMRLMTYNPINRKKLDVWLDETRGNGETRLFDDENPVERIKKMINDYREYLPFIGVEFKFKKVSDLPLDYKLELRVKDEKAKDRENLLRRAMTYAWR